LQQERSYEIFIGAGNRAFGLIGQFIELNLTLKSKSGSTFKSVFKVFSSYWSSIGGEGVWGFINKFLGLSISDSVRPVSSFKSIAT